jgi:hypothetical protein
MAAMPRHSTPDSRQGAPSSVRWLSTPYDDPFENWFDRYDFSVRPRVYRKGLTWPHPPNMKILLSVVRKLLTTYAFRWLSVRPAVTQKDFPGQVALLIADACILPKWRLSRTCKRGRGNPSNTTLPLKRRPPPNKTHRTSSYIVLSSIDPLQIRFLRVTFGLGRTVFEISNVEHFFYTALHCSSWRHSPK